VVLEARVRQPVSASRESSKDDAAGKTMNYVADAHPPSVPEVRLPVARPADPEATMNEAVAPVVRPSRPPAASPLLIPDDDGRSAPAPVERRSAAAPVVVKPATRRKPATSEPSARGLSDLSVAAEGLASSLRDLQTELVGALEAVDQAGGRAALQAIVAQVQRVEANPRSAEEIDALVGWLPTARRMLEAELTLTSLLTRNQSDALG
jgi:hypothetical protein